MVAEGIIDLLHRAEATWVQVCYQKRWNSLGATSALRSEVECEQAVPSPRSGDPSHETHVYSLQRLPAHRSALLAFRITHVFWGVLAIAQHPISQGQLSEVPSPPD